jgi:hypothetical protein
VTTRFWADKYATDHAAWSDGSHASSAEYYLGQIVVDSSAVRIRTVDPDRVIARVAGAIDYAAAGIGEYTNALFTGGACGLTATISACSGQGTKQVVGGNCAPLAFTQGACVTTEPHPGTPGGLREAAGTALNEATGNLDATSNGGILGPLAGGGTKQPCRPTSQDPDCNDDQTPQTSDKKWTIGERMRSAGPGGTGLPSEGPIRYVPRRDYNPSAPLPRGPNNGYLDRFDNEWTVGPSRTSGEPYEWDVQLSRIGRKRLHGWTKGDSHANVSLRGWITHRD